MSPSRDPSLLAALRLFEVASARPSAGDPVARWRGRRERQNGAGIAGQSGMVEGTIDTHGSMRAR